MADGETLGKRSLKPLLQAALILLMGAVLGGGFNALRPNGLPWVRTSSLPTEEGSAPPMGMYEAWAAFQKGAVLFVDARSSSEYAAGHLPGAVNLQVDQGQQAVAGFRPPEGRDLVVYCSDPACTKSSELAALLSSRGIKRLRIMHEGWAGWFEAGLPFEESGP